MITVITTEEIVLTVSGTSLEGNTTETQLEVGSDVTWWMSEPIRSGFGVDMVWKVELEGWVGAPEDRTTNPRVNFKEVSPFYNIKLFNEDGTPKYPFDSIEEIKKGVRGGDCIQTVHTREIQNCGKIYYESKRTKDFQKSWIEKFKADMREKGADIGVLVTEVLPKELDRMGLIDGVWICTYEEFKGLSSVLRESIIKINQAKKSEENKTDKMSLLYGYLTSTEFKMQIEAIVEGFTQMQSDLDSEKRSMQRIWKQREKQIEKVLDNTIGMYGSIKGIAGNSIGNVKALELPYSNIEEEND